MQAKGRSIRSFYAVAVAAIVLTMAGVLQAAPAAGVPSVDPKLATQLQHDPTTGYLIYFNNKPDLTPAYKKAQPERARWVVNQLTAAASQAQSSVKLYLNEQHIQYKSFWIDNVIDVTHSDMTIVNKLLSFNEIRELRAKPDIILFQPEVNPGVNHVETVEPNIAFVKADQVWGMGFRGDGLVVSNIDCGVRYTHDALVRQYRGNNGDGTFTHDYNWFDPYGQCISAPCDTANHGTHTMGTMVGEDASQTNQIGMAPGAKWMACLGLPDGSGSTDGLLSCAQFMAAPTKTDGTVPDPTKHPDVVNNSWGDCVQTHDPWYDGVIDAWRAEGIYPMFANGNAPNCGYSEPPGCNTVGDPARYGKATGVGAMLRDSYAYATFSNWGPTDSPYSPPNGPGYPDLKPNVSAPGDNIRSSVGTGDSDYQSGWSGTSMATPHVSGLVALMWEAAPCLKGDVDKTMVLLESSVHPVPYATACSPNYPAPGDEPNCATGWGEIDAVAAVNAAISSCGPQGELKGVVYSATGPVPPNPGWVPIAGATVTVVGTYTFTATTAADGSYDFPTIPVDTYSVTASKFGFSPTTVTGVGVTEGNITTQNLAIQATGSNDVDGYVTDAGHGWPLYAQIVITATGAPTTTVYTNPFNGYYDVTLVNGYDYTFTVNAVTPGYAQQTRPVSVTGTDQTQSFSMVPKTPLCSVGGYGPPAAPSTHPVGSTKQTSHSLVTPPGQRNATSLRGVHVTAPAHAPGAPLAAGDVIANWPTGLGGVWGADYDQTDGTVWVGTLPVAYGGDGNDHEYQTNGTSTSRIISESWAGVFAADMTYDTVNGTLWQLDVGGDNCAHELSPVTLTTTGNTICPAFGTSERGLAYDPTTDTFFAGGWNDLTVFRFNRSGTILESVNTGIYIAGLAYNKTTNHLFAIDNWSPNQIWVLDPSNGYAVLNSFTVAGFGDYSGGGLEFDCQGHLWATNQGDGNAYEIDSGEAGSCAAPGPCTVINGGVVAGFVKDGNTNTGIVGAKVANDLGGSTFTLNDPNNGPGYYSFFTPTPPFNGPAMRTFTASDPHYASVSIQEAITPNTVNRLDFTLQAGWLSIAPTSLFDFLNPGQTDDQTLFLTNHGGLDANFQLMVIPQQLYVAALPRDAAGPIVVPPQGKHKLLRNLKGIQLNAPPPNRGTPLAAGDVITTWPNVSTNNWGVGYAQLTDRVWVGSVSYFGGDGKDHEYKTDGTPTGNTVDTTWMTVPYPADMAFDPLHNTMWQMNVNIGTQEIDEFDPATQTWTGNKIIVTGLPNYYTGLAYDSSSDTFFIGGWTDSMIYRFDRTGTVVQSKNVGLSIAGLAYNGGTGHLFVIENSTTDTVTVLDVNNNYNVVGSFTVAGFGNYAGAGLEFDCQGHLWALNQVDQKTYEIDSGETGTCPWMGVPWLTLTPTSGLVPAHNETSPFPIDAQFIADGAPLFGQYEAQIMTTSDTPYPTTPVSVCFTKAYTDVPQGSFAEKFIHAVSGAHITQGCGGSMFCPGDVMTRGTMARWMLIARHGAGYTVPRCVGIFVDVPCETTPNADYIEAFYNEGITAGCHANPLMYCPNDPVSRAQMAVFVMKSWQGPSYVPPACTGIFNDVACPGGFAVNWIEDLYNHGITAGCGNGNFCPDLSTTRAEESVFIEKAWAIPMCSAPTQPVKK